MSRIIVDAFGKNVELAMKDKAKVIKLTNAIEKYFDRNHSIVFAQGPSKHLFFVESDKDVMFEVLGYTRDEMKAVLKTVPLIKSTWKKLNEPFIISSVLVIRELTIQKKTVERDKVLMFLAFFYYALAQRQFFNYEPNEQVMAYTLTTLSDKFKYKTLVNNYRVLDDTVKTSHNTYEKILIEGKDEMFPIYVSQMENRIYKLIKNIAVLFYDNLNHKRYLNVEESSFDDTGEIRDTETSSSIINDLADGVTLDFMSQRPNYKLATMAANKNDVSVAHFYQALINIRQNEDKNSISTMIRNILTVIFEDDNSSINNVCSSSFAVNALKLISVRNTVQKDLENIKTTLDSILQRHCIKYAQVDRLATKMAYRNALYTYLVYLIITHKCK